LQLQNFYNSQSQPESGFQTQQTSSVAKAN